MNVFVDSFQESAIKMGLRCFVKTEEYWQAKWEIMERIKLEFDKKGIAIPFNQMEVTLKSNS